MQVARKSPWSSVKRVTSQVATEQGKKQHETSPHKTQHNQFVLPSRLTNWMLPLGRNAGDSHAPSNAFIGHKAFAQCQQLTAVDLSQTQVDIAHMQVFAHCQALAQISLPRHLGNLS